MFELVVPKSSIPGSPENIAATLTNAKRYALIVEQDARPLVRNCRNLRELKVWETWLSDEPRTWERFCKEALGYDAAFLAEIEEGVSILERKGTAGPIPATVAQAATTAQRIRQAAEKTTGEVLPKHTHPDSTISHQAQSNRAQENGVSHYTQKKLDRLARQYPDLHEDVRQGRKSVNRAAIEAGIVKETLNVPLEPDAIARAIIRHFDRAQVSEIVRLLVEASVKE